MPVSACYYDSEDGLRLFYRYYGSEHPTLPVFCLPGITRNSRDFEDIADHLADRYPVICPDFRGRGFSERDPQWQNYQPMTYVKDVQRLMDELAIPRAAFIGTSLGGIVSTALVHLATERVAGVILNDIGPEIGAKGLERIKTYIGRVPPVKNWDEAIAQAQSLYGDAWPGLTDKQWQHLVRRSYRENEKGVPVLDMDPQIGEAARKVTTSLDDPWKIYEALENIPTMVVHGALSDILTDEIVEKMQKHKPDLQHVLVKNRGHVPLLDEPECVAAIDKFLEDLN
ncbi:MAG: alpha/beta hydrolase [Woeseia sp.]|nr:alpha/beta hydrolase [Woeseia sp.]NNE60339.1 alpha/beta hydrolase [Woeseia sp.]NNL53651.1 alpha/beta hydrolase [Woeseia sp.]